MKKKTAKFVYSTTEDILKHNLVSPLKNPASSRTTVSYHILHIGCGLSVHEHKATSFLPVNQTFPQVNFWKQKNK
jgi:hypothetical protein